MIKPSNIKGKTFETTKNGYNQSAVDSFLSEVAADYAEAIAANQENEDKIMKLVEKINEYREDEDAIKMALLSAQKEANKILADAKARAKDIIESAKSEQMKLAEQSASECEKIVREHKERCAQLIKENTEITEKKITALREAYNDEKAAYDELRAEVTYFKANLTGLYNEQIKLIMQLPTLTDEELEAYEQGYIDEETSEEEYYEEETEGEYYDDEPASEEEYEEAPEEETSEEKITEQSEIDKVLNTGSFEPVIPKSSFSDLKFGKNN
ncbi:MAG: DivIVA domain-containing protein [Ruminococcus sp.]|nr:DivIVA domain-containing protein [Ruminococcus sp.]